MSSPISAKHLVTVQLGSPLDKQFHQLTKAMDLPCKFDLLDWMEQQGAKYHGHQGSGEVWAFESQEHWMEFFLTWLD
jgi:hypothetical protein